MLPVDELLHSYSNKYVTVHDQLTINNREIATGFVRNFCHYLQKEKGLNVGYETQGSAFEGIKVSTPDEFDYLLCILKSSNYGSFSANDPIMVRFGEVKVKNPAAVSSYVAITLGSDILKNPEFRNFQEKMPGTNSDIFSAQQTVRRFQTYINDYVQMIPYVTQYQIKGVRNFRPPSIDNPALTTVLEKGDGTDISIDMNVCAKLNETTFITKRKTISGIVGKDREAMNMLWMTSHSLQEKEEITKRRSSSQIKNYRIAKAILREKLPNSYIMKTIFLREENAGLVQTPYEFLSYMIDSLKQGYGAELERRNGSATNRNKKLLLGRFNQNENVLAKFGYEEIKNLHSYFESLSQSRSKDGNRLLEDLLGEKLTALKQKKGIAISVPIGRFGNYDGDDYDCCG